MRGTGVASCDQNPVGYSYEELDEMRDEAARLGKMTVEEAVWALMDKRMDHIHTEQELVRCVALAEHVCRHTGLAFS